MSTLPRRTTALNAASATKQNVRQSRIAQPIRYRGSSLDRHSHGYGNLLEPNMPGSGMKRPQRSCSATPLLTPNRPILQTSIASTCEKDRAPLEDKRRIQSQAHAITNYLHFLEPQLGADFFRGGLKTMSTKQFVVIINHFLTFLAGNRFRVQVNNYVDNIVDTLTQLGYPYTINKSWLKTPTAPHSFNNIVALLAWLMTFVTTQETIEMFQDEILIENAELVDLEYTILFTTQAAGAFHIWNETKEEEFNKVKGDLMDIYVQKVTGIENLHTVEKQTKEFYKEYDNLLQHKIVVENEDEFFKLDAEVRSNQKALAKLEDMVNENSKNLEEVERACDIKVKMVQELRSNINNLKTAIENQMISTKDRDELIKEISHLKIRLDTKKDLILKLQNIGSTNQILLARLMRKKCELVAELNSYIYKIFSDSLNAVSNVHDLCINESNGKDINEQIEKLKPLLEDVKGKNNRMTIEYTNVAVQLENKLQTSTTEYNTILVKRFADISNHCQEIEAELLEVHANFTKAKSELIQHIDNLSIAKKDYENSNNNLIISIQSEEEKLEKKRKENKTMSDFTVSESSKIVDVKEEKFKELESVVTSLQNQIREVKQKINDMEY